MKKNMTFHKRKIWVVLLCCILMMTGLIGRLIYLMCFRSDYYYKKAKELYQEQLSSNANDMEMDRMDDLYQQAVQSGWIS